MFQRLRSPKLSAALPLIGAVIWLSHLAFAHTQERDTWLDGLESRLLDLQYRIVGTRAAAPDIVFVAIDDETLESDIAAPDGRLLLAKLIQHIADNGAQSLVLDVLLADEGTLAERKSLATALSQLPAVIAAAVRFDKTGTASVIWPHDDFAAQADVGLVNLQTDATGTPRFVPMFLEVSGQTLPSMPLIAAVNLTGAEARIDERSMTLGSSEIPLDNNGYMPLRLLGPTGTIPTISAIKLIETSPVEALSDKLVVLGYSAAGTGDLFATPFDDEVPGAEIIATAISQLVGGVVLRHDVQTRNWDVLHAVLLTAVCLFLMLRAPLIRALPIGVCILLLSFAGVTYAFSQGLWLSAALPLLGAAPPMLLAGALSLAQERRNARLSEQSLTSLRRFHSPALARQIEQDPDFLSKPRQQALVVFFVDLTGFTTLSQKLGSEGTRALLQQFHGLTGEIVETHNGNVINFMGDGALAVFGLEPDKEAGSAADLALQSAEALDNALADLSLPRGCSAVTCRTGLHYGSVILSRLGAQNHQQVTVSGDTVNLASRLMEVAKSQNARIVATKEFANQLSPQTFSDATRSTQVAVRGWSGDVEVVLWPRN